MWGTARSFLEQALTRASGEEVSREASGFSRAQSDPLGDQAPNESCTDASVSSLPRARLRLSPRHAVCHFM